MTLHSYHSGKGRWGNWDVGLRDLLRSQNLFAGRFGCRKDFGRHGFPLSSFILNHSVSLSFRRKPLKSSYYPSMDMTVSPAPSPRSFFWVRTRVRTYLAFPGQPTSLPLRLLCICSPIQWALLHEPLWAPFGIPRESHNHQWKEIQSWAVNIHLIPPILPHAGSQWAGCGALISSCILLASTQRRGKGVLFSPITILNGASGCHRHPLTAWSLLTALLGNYGLH